MKICSENEKSSQGTLSTLLTTSDMRKKNRINLKTCRLVSEGYSLEVKSMGLDILTLKCPCLISVAKFCKVTDPDQIHR